MILPQWHHKSKVFIQWLLIQIKRWTLIKLFKNLFKAIQLFQRSTLKRSILMQNLLQLWPKICLHYATYMKTSCSRHTWTIKWMNQKFKASSKNTPKQGLNSAWLTQISPDKLKERTHMFIWAYCKRISWMSWSWRALPHWLNSIGGIQSFMDKSQHRSMRLKLSTTLTIWTTKNQ
jgi:hypothetical protein